MQMTGSEMFTCRSNQFNIRVLARPSVVSSSNRVTMFTWIVLKLGYLHNWVENRVPRRCKQSLTGLIEWRGETV